MESLGVLTIIMVLMLHPAICFVFGKFSDCIYRIVCLIYRKTCKKQDSRKTNCSNFFARLFVLSLNVYIALIGCIMYYLFKQSMAFRESSDVTKVAMFDFKGVKFNRCECPDNTKRPDCFDVKDNFQNYFNFLPNEAFLLSLIVVPFLMHVFHVALLHLTPPVPMLNFVLGSKYEDDVQESKAIDEIEMEPMDITLKVPTNDQQSPKIRLAFSMTHWICLVFGSLMLLAIAFLPYGYVYLFRDAEERDG